jgi:hypothetical protein
MRSTTAKICAISKCVKYAALLGRVSGAEVRRHGVAVVDLGLEPF